MFRLFLQISLDSNIQNLIPAVRKNNSIGHSLSLSFFLSLSLILSFSFSLFSISLHVYYVHIIILKTFFFLKKWANPNFFCVYFLSLQTNKIFFQQINVKKCLFSLWRRDLDPRLLQHESSTRPQDQG